MLLFRLFCSDIENIVAKSYSVSKCVPDGLCNNQKAQLRFCFVHSKPKYPHHLQPKKAQTEQKSSWRLASYKLYYSPIPNPKTEATKRRQVGVKVKTDAGGAEPVF